MSNVVTISLADLSAVTGGQAVDFDDVRRQAQQYCPVTADKYKGLKPGQINQALGRKMGDECLAEMDPATRFFARGKIDRGVASLPK